MMRAIGWILGTLIALPILFVAFIFISYQFGADGPLCTNSEGRYIWYTKDEVCNAIEYRSCRKDIYNTPPKGATPDCTLEGKVQFLRETETFAQNCQVAFEKGPDRLGFREGLSKFDNAAIEACKPYISQEDYQEALANPDIDFYLKARKARTGNR